MSILVLMLAVANDVVHICCTTTYTMQYLFCLTVLFFQRSRFRCSSKDPLNQNFWGGCNARFLQTGCPSRHPTNSVKALK